MAWCRVHDDCAVRHWRQHSRHQELAPAIAMAIALHQQALLEAGDLCTVGPIPAALVNLSHPAKKPEVAI